MIRSACRARIGSLLRVSLSSFTFQFVHDNRFLEYSFARGAEACTNDRATICSFRKTKNIDRARKRREEKRVPVPVEETSTEEEQLGCSGAALLYSPRLENTPKLRVLSRNLIGGEEKRKKTEGKVEMGEDVKNDEREKEWIVKQNQHDRD
ncbi:hypothetical protein G5I_14749 [Acromyrmex echinatior]|uniref:Uncharacterized protein n=1 Tax=Acromyrmex echinatior TaxID=103372 RepID=F4X8L0_ACREC|nr:hypothetical protein G5I_14749 [Acromyrmex echinatior]